MEITSLKTNFRFLTFFWAVVLAAFLSPFHDAARSAPQVIQKIEALVNDEAITAYDVGQRMGLVLLASGRTLGSEEELLQLRAQVLESLIDEKLQVQEAKEYEVPVPEEEVYEVYARVASSYNRTPENFDDLLNKYGTSSAAMIKQIEGEYAWQTLVNGRYGNFAQARADEVEAVLENMQANAGKREYRLSEIFLISSDPSQDERVRQTAQRIKDQTDAFQFPEMARQFSQSSTSAQGGDLGWVNESQIQPEILEVIRDMDILEVSDPIKVAGGYYIVALTDRRSILKTEPLDETLTLRQVGWFFTRQTTEEEALKWLEIAEAKAAEFNSCENLGDFVAALGPNAVSRDLGNVPLKQLNPELRKIIMPIPANRATEPINTPEGFVVFIVCDRFMPEAKLPTPEVIQQQIETQRIALMSRRYLRDLRRDAIIDYK